MQRAQDASVDAMLCVSVTLNDVKALEAISDRYNHVYISVGMHPNTVIAHEPDVSTLQSLTTHPRCIAIGETGLDYYHADVSPSQQATRFRTHIQTAHITQKPLIIHTRQAAEDTIKIMREEHASDIGGVMHCFSENWDIARLALDLNFYISFSGILTFKNAQELRDVASRVPLDRILIETDAPYLAPHPFRGKQNEPAYVRHVAESLSTLRGIPYETVTSITTDNFNRCFRITA
jgi:TatD DNase family protein